MKLSSPGNWIRIKLTDYTSPPHTPGIHEYFPPKHFWTHWVFHQVSSVPSVNEIHHSIRQWEAWTLSTLIPMHHPDIMGISFSQQWQCLTWYLGHWCWADAGPSSYHPITLSTPRQSHKHHTQFFWLLERTKPKALHIIIWGSQISQKIKSNK